MNNVYTKDEQIERDRAVANVIELLDGDEPLNKLAKKFGIAAKDIRGRINDFYDRLIGKKWPERKKYLTLLGVDYRGYSPSVSRAEKLQSEAEDEQSCLEFFALVSAKVDRAAIGFLMKNHKSSRPNRKASEDEQNLYKLASEFLKRAAKEKKQKIKELQFKVYDIT